MSENTNKIFGDNDDYITLSELAKNKKYSLEYLLNAANRGKLKAFKMGDDWITTMEWFDNYQSFIKENISLEISGDEDDSSKWVDLFPNNRFRVVYLRQMLLVLLVLSMFSFSFSWLAYYPAGNRVILATKNILDSRYIVSSYFLGYTNLAYSSAYKPVSFMFSSSVQSADIIYDGATILLASSVDATNTLYNTTSRYQFSDEAVTEKFYQLLELAKSSYKNVAGTSHIRQQIYYDEWEKAME